MRALVKIFSAGMAIAFTFGSVIASASASASAETYPNRSIRLIVPFAPGGTVDILGRMLADNLSKAFKQQVIVENKPGAGGTLGADMVAKSRPDGYTLLLASSAHQTFHGLLYKRLPYDPQKDFVQVALFATVPNVLVISKKTPANSVKELIALAKSREKNLFMGSSGAGGVNHLIGEYFQLKTGTKFEHVPYKGAGLANNDLISGQIDLMFVNMPTVLAQIKAGKLQALAVASKSRSALLPEVPTMAEAGISDFIVDSWSGILAPAGTPSYIVDKLAQAIIKIANSKEIAESLAGIGAEPRPGNSQDYHALVDDEMKRWKFVIQNSSISLE